MKPQEFISFAGHAAARMVHTPDCATIRTVASRAYYGAFHLAIAFLAGLACAPAADGHGTIRHLVEASGTLDGQELANLRLDMHRDRLKADYDLSNTAIETYRFAQLSVETAVDFNIQLNTFKQSCDDPVIRQSVIDAIRAYCDKMKIPLRN